jgi:hypothetical protein
LLAVSAVVACALTLWAAWRIANIRSSAKLYRAENTLKQEIDKELPVGSEKAAVSEFLKAHSAYSDGFRPLNEGYRALYKGAAGIMIATTQDIETPILSCRIVVTFRFDKAGKLEDHDDKFACNGPI